MNEQNERINENGMNPDSNNIENETGREMCIRDSAICDFVK